MTRSISFIFFALAIVACSEPAADVSAPEPRPSVQAPAPTPVAPAVADDKQANEAYEAKQYDKCGAMYLALAEQRKGKRKLTTLYNAACCQALAGQRDAAFATLAGGVVASDQDLAHFEKDPDLASLHADPRWPKLVAATKQKLVDAERAMTDPALRKELLALYAEDQVARKAYIAKQDDKALQAAVEVIDAKTMKRMREVVAKYKWPGKSIVGEDGANAAWLLVQHADKDPAFQKQCLANMEPLVATGEVTEIDYAYLYDRVAVADKRPQRYGTQFDDKRQPRPIEDEANVDKRRAAIGLPTMAAYKQDMLRMYGPPK